MTCDRLGMSTTLIADHALLSDCHSAVHAHRVQSLPFPATDCRRVVTVAWVSPSQWVGCPNPDVSRPSLEADLVGVSAIGKVGSRSPAPSEWRPRHTGDATRDVWRSDRVLPVVRGDYRISRRVDSPSDP